ncbi:hypothetical protein RI864_002085 [Salmonella enterica]|nr:hypothetical protein [Salmonella enterica]EBW8697966.1 hypothetical protein [Salmonella enterica subsp. diarizonae serovar 16:z10:e,n,x,z15]EAA9130249.1 hypothetical protein [Salmonella enterica]EAA9597783.1 hypothetical protein [Salmonella enterica]EAM8741765.1 hypothetical protein [Salmonella enterica]
MKIEITFAPLVLACLLLSACSYSHDQTEQSSTGSGSYISLGVFPASRDGAKNIPVEIYDETFITKEVSTENRKDGQTIRKALTEPFRVGLQAVATPVFNADGTSKMVLKGTFNCISKQYSPSSDPQMSIHLTRTYDFVLEKKAYPGDRLAVRASVPGACTKDKEELPVMLLKDKEVPQNH